MSHQVIITILSALLLFSEALGGIKALADNSIYQLVIRVLKILADLVSGNKATAPQA